MAGSGRTRRARRRTESDAARLPSRAPLRAAFATPQLRRCQLAIGTSGFVEIALLVVVSVHLFDRAGASAVAVFGVVRTVSPAVLTPLLTSVVSRAAPGRGLAWCLAVAAVGVGGTAALVAVSGPIVSILAAAAITGIAAGGIRAVVSSLLPGLISDPAVLVATNTAASMVDNLSTTAGPLVAGVALATVGPVALLWGIAVALVAVTLAIATMRTVQVVRTTTTHLFADVVDGARQLLRTPAARLMALLVTSQTIVRGAMNVLVVVLAIDRLGLGESGVGLLIGMIGVGGLLGLPVAARVAGRGQPGRTLAAALLLWGLPLVGVGLLTADAVVVVLFAVIGVGNTLVDISSDTTLQRALPAGSMSRALGVYEALLLAGKAAGAALGGQLLLVTDVGTALVVVGAFLPVVVLLSAAALLRLDESMRARDTGVALLQLNAIFSPLVLATVDQVARTARTTAYAAGASIVTEGEVGHEVHVIESGEAEVVRGGSAVATLGPGDCFGEMAVLDDAPRNASVIARTDVVARSLGRDAFLQTIGSDDAARTAATRLADERRPD